MLPVDLSELLRVSPWGTLLQCLSEDLLGTHRANSRTACIAIRGVPCEGLDHVPLVGLVLVDLEELILAKVVVLAGDRLEVLVEGADDELSDRLQLGLVGGVDANDIVTLKIRHGDTLVLLEGILPEKLQEHGLASPCTIALVGRQDRLSPVVLVGEDQHCLLGFYLFQERTEGCLEGFDGILLEGMECPHAIAPVISLFAYGRCLVGEDVGVDESNTHGFTF